MKKTKLTVSQRPYPQEVCLLSLSNSHDKETDTHGKSMTSEFLLSTSNFLLFSATSFPYLPMSMINESTKIGWWLLATFSTCWGSRTCDSNKNQPEPWFKPWALQISNDFLRARSSDLLRHGQYNKTNVFSRGCGRYVKKNDLAKGHCQSK